MSLQIGIVGLPNVGKSTLFKALTKKAAETANYAFTTIEPNVGIVNVPDQRLDDLAHLSQSKKIVPTTTEFVDIAGLVKGAAAGEGLGNKFLSHIREVDAIAEVVRVFPDPKVNHVHEQVDPARDIKIIETELILADLEVVDKRLSAVARTARSGQKEALQEKSVLEKIKKALDTGRAVRALTFDREEQVILKTLNLLTAKPIMYIANVSEDQFKDKSGLANLNNTLGLDNKTVIVPVSAKIESELSELKPTERQIFLKELGLAASGLDDVIEAAYLVLGLITFFTSGEPESRAWTVRRGARAPQAAGQIHTDFEKGFIKAETIFWKDLIDTGGWVQAREKGLVRAEGKDYVVKDGDVMLFRFSPAHSA